MDRDNQGTATNVFKDQMGSGLSSPAVTLTKQELQQLASGWHLLQRKGDGLGI